MMINSFLQKFLYFDFSYARQTKMLSERQRAFFLVDIFDATNLIPSFIAACHIRFISDDLPQDMLHTCYERDDERIAETEIA